jgi:transcriptional regulator with XRE-family HTH domain
MIQMESSKVIIGKMIAYNRNKKKITQQQFADLLGVDRQYVWRIENGKVNLTLNYLDKLILHLNCTHGDFIVIIPVKVT